MQKKDAEAVERVLGEPVAGDFPENALKVRRNLLVVSLVGILLVLTGAKLNPDSDVMGFRFLGITESLVRMSLLASTAYLWIHFAWYTIDAFSEWRLRLTGTRLAFVTTAKFASEEGDYPDNPRHSTLYTWWSQRSRHISSALNAINDVEIRLKDIEASVKAGHNPNAGNELRSLAENLNALADLRRQMETLSKILESQRIPTSLKRFDGWFGFFLRSQNLRWIVMDAGLPLIGGAWALVLLFRHPY